MDSRSVAIAPFSAAGADGALDHPASPTQAPIPIVAFTMSDPGVQVAPIHAFTFDRSGRPPWAGTRKIRASGVVSGLDDLQVEASLQLSI